MSSPGRPDLRAEGAQRRLPLAGPEAEQFKALLSTSAFVAAFSFAAYLSSTTAGEGEPVEDVGEPDYLFDTPQDAVKSMIAGLERALSGAPDDLSLLSRARAFARDASPG